MSDIRFRIRLKIFGFLFLFLGVLITVIITLNYPTISSVQNAVAAFYAKEMCSCIFVSGRSEEFCLNYARQPVDPFSLKTDFEKKTVTVNAAGLTKKGYYISRNLGCGFE